MNCSSKSHISFADISEKLPEYDKDTVTELLQKEVQKNNRKIVVLDDDPTGVQTVHDVSVYTRWDKESITAGFLEKNPLFYILTNSRSLSAHESEILHRAVTQTIISVSKELKRDFLLISRSDSTLRGHYPLETEIMREVFESKLKHKIDGEILCFFFKEGGRFTIDNTHYVQYGDNLIPAGQTEFAQDKTFGYSASDLCNYIEEKTKGRCKASDVVSISLADLRTLQFEKIEAQLMSARNFQRIVVNAVDAFDVKVFCIAAYRAIAKGKKFIFRSAAALVKEMGGIADRPLLTRKELNIQDDNCAGLIIVGSHTQKTTEQLYTLLDTGKVTAVPFDSDLVLKKELLQKEIERVTNEVEKSIKTGISAAVFTKRKLLSITNDTKEAALQRSVEISHALQSIVSHLNVKPAFIIAKGGITSSDIGTKALGVRKATVQGQLCPGVPVWQLGPESVFPGIPYVIFPGNVGGTNTLQEAYEKLM
ncbi:hydroxyacid dehydrogenase [Treponema sp. OMZ 840]|uniref:four-carbon acid sugar kinase family protein n=1 Tax=Treponema sp. OMZ 840 TaxID=244313 RepID=UPI003D8E8752